MTATPTPAFFDLIYVLGPTPADRTMACAVRTSAGDTLHGPYPAAQAGPAIAQALTTHPELGLTNPKDAEQAYILTHFGNLSRGHNAAGQAYPHRLPEPTA